MPDYDAIIEAVQNKKPIPDDAVNLTDWVTGAVNQFGEPIIIKKKGE